jgi:NADH:ubiquinone oxidoreductase subunit 3 (subunit A)
LVTSSDVLQAFGVSFYIVGIPLIIFGIGLVLILPWAKNINFLILFFVV